MLAKKGRAYVPQGLEYLASTSLLLVHQKVKLFGEISGYTTENTYTVTNSLGQKVFSVVELSGCWARNFCGANRSFEMKIFDNGGREVIHLHQPESTGNCFSYCTMRRAMEVSSPPGILIGSIEHVKSYFKNQLKILDASGDVLFLLDCPLCMTSLCGQDIEFKLMHGRDCEVQVGKISKKWSGFLKEAFTDAENYAVDFPVGMDVKMKATILASCFLIDLLFFQG